MLKQRVLTAIPLALTVLITILWLDPLYLQLLLALVLWLAAMEWARLLGVQSIFMRGLYAVLAGLIAAGVFVTQQQAYFDGLIAAMAGLWIGLSFYLLRLTSIDPVNAGSRRLHLSLGLALMPLAVVSLLQIRMQFEQGEWLLMYVLSVIWAADTAAYFSGKRWGQRPLAKVVSPGKSLEGAFGGLLGVAAWSSLVFFLGSGWGLSYPVFVLLSLFSAALSISGDLYESLIKRKAGVKDSGRILPGHGGILDRVDSVLAAAPVFLAGLLWLGANA